MQTLGEVDVVCLLVEANAPIGPGDRFIAELVARRLDAQDPRRQQGRRRRVATRSASSSRGRRRELGEFDAFVPSRRGPARASTRCSRELESRLPEGPHYYPDGVVSDQPETMLVAELLREKLLAIARDELPHSIVVTAEPLEDDSTTRTGPTPALGRGAEDEEPTRSCGTGSWCGSSGTPRRGS